MATYARQAVARSSAGFTVSGTSVSLTSVVNFPAVVTGSATATHFAVGKASSGTGEILFSGPVAPVILIAAGITPQLGTGTTITETGANNSSGNNLWKLLFNNTTWAGIGDATGLVGSTVVGSLYLSLHTGDPTATGNQTSSEVSYT